MADPSLSNFLYFHGVFLNIWLNNRLPPHLLGLVSPPSDVAFEGKLGFSLLLEQNKFYLTTKTKKRFTKYEP